MAGAVELLRVWRGVDEGDGEEGGSEFRSGGIVGRWVLSN